MKTASHTATFTTQFANYSMSLLFCCHAEKGLQNQQQTIFRLHLMPSGGHITPITHH